MTHLPYMPQVDLTLDRFNIRKRLTND